MSSKSSETNVIKIKNRRHDRLSYLAGNVTLPNTKQRFVGSRSKYDPQKCDAIRGYRQ